MEQDKKKAYTLLINVIFVIWFALSFVAMVILAKAENYPALFIILGQYLLGFGLYMLSSGKKLLFPGICLIIVGLTVIVLTFLHNWGSNFGIELNTPYVSGICFLILYIFVSGYVCFKGVLNKKTLKKSCDTYIEAECVEVKILSNRGKGKKEHILYKPVFLYEYNGEKHLVQSNFYYKTTELKKGDLCGLYINSQNPKKFYNKEVLKYTNLYVVLWGILCVIGIGILAVIIKLGGNYGI